MLLGQLADQRRHVAGLGVAATGGAAAAAGCAAVLLGLRILLGRRCRPPALGGWLGVWLLASPARAPGSGSGCRLGFAASGFGLRLAARPAGGAAAPRLADHGQHGADLDGLVLLDPDLQQRAGGRGGDLGVDLVGGDLQQRLVGLDRVADLLEPAAHRALGDALAQCGQGHLGPAGGAATRIAAADRRRRIRRHWTLRAPVSAPARPRHLLGVGRRARVGLRLGRRRLGLLRFARPRTPRPPASLAGAAFGLARLADHGQHRADLDGLVLLRLDLQQHPGGGGGDLGVDLVGGDLQQRLVGLDGVTDLLEPPAHGAFGDAFAEGGESYRSRHGWLDSSICALGSACRCALWSQR